MKNKALIIFLVFLSGLLMGGLALMLYRNELRGPELRSWQVPSGPSGEAADFSEIVRAVSPSVVNISVIKRQKKSRPYVDQQFFDYFDDFFNPPGEDEDLGGSGTGMYRERSQGSGLVVTPDGYIITNYHVVGGAEKIKVTMYDRRIFSGQLIGADRQSDIAIIKVEAEDLATIPWGDSDSLKVGQFVLSIGNPYGLSHTVTLGIISATGRANVGITDYEDFIQTDAAINPGNSGGPLVNTRGELAGINTAIFSKSGGYQGIGFSVPSNIVRSVMDQILSTGRVVRGWIGAALQDLTPELGREFNHMGPGGALVSDVFAEGPAEASGLRAGDIILRFDGHEVSDSSSLKNRVARSRPGQTVQAQVLRGGGVIEITMSVGEKSEQAAEATIETSDRKSGGDALDGLGVITLTPEVASQLQMGRDVRGVVIESVREGSAASEAGLKRGDVIMEMGRKPTQNMDEYLKAAPAVSRKAAVLMYINRGGRKFYTTLSAQ